ncbi:MAG: hypothetical protein ACKVZJ_10390 [Phycisphaerales bacterium]
MDEYWLDEQVVGVRSDGGAATIAVVPEPVGVIGGHGGFVVSRQGKVPEGWSKQGVVVPDEVWRAVQHLAARHGYGSLKALATAAFGVLAGMPDHHRLALLRWIAQAQVGGPGDITPEAVWNALQESMRTDIGNARVIGPVERVRVPKPAASDSVAKLVEGLKQRPLPTEQTHEVTRILDPGILGKKKAKKEDAA